MFKATENTSNPKISRNSHAHQNYGSIPFFQVQTKLSVGKADDGFEREADSVATKVVSQSENSAFGSSDTFFPPVSIQKKESLKPEEELQKKTSERGSILPTNIDSTLKSTKGSGNFLGGKMKTEMEQKFGADFSKVKIHTNNVSSKMNNELGAQAFTNGNDIYFNSGKFNPTSKDGKHLLAHELTHTLQQNGATIKKQGADLKSPRFRGDITLENALDGISFVKFGSSGTSVVLMQQGLIDAGFPLPKFGADGQFGSETQKAVRDYQTANALSADGVIGPFTMAALDLYYSVDRGADPLPPLPGSNEEKILSLLKKGEKMTKKEAQEIKQLLFQLNGDDFKRALKAAMESADFFRWIKKMGIVETLDAMAKTTSEVVISTTLLKPAADVIDSDFKRANEIYNPKGIEIEKGNATVLSEKETKAIIGNELILDEFTGASATAEELKLIKHNRGKGRISGYWVPGMSDGSRGEALIKSDLGNMPDDRTSVVVNSSNKAQDTFAHEVGHILGLDHEATDDPNNLMTRGAKRKIAGKDIDQLTDAQLAVIRNSLFLEIGKKGVGK